MAGLTFQQTQKLPTEFLAVITMVFQIPGLMHLKSVFVFLQSAAVSYRSTLFQTSKILN